MAVTFIPLRRIPQVDPIGSKFTSGKPPIASENALRDPTPLPAMQLPRTPEIGDEAPDWREEGARAAASIIAPEAFRKFGPMTSPDSSRAPSEISIWDKTQTDKIQTLPTGGVLVRLSENCQLVISVIPLVGCTLGKREARGDLFDDLKKPKRQDE